LRNLIPALKRGARVVVMDNVLPEPGALPLWPEERIRYDSFFVLFFLLLSYRVRVFTPFPPAPPHLPTQTTATTDSLG
jgi:hypothetical protein